MLCHFQAPLLLLVLLQHILNFQPSGALLPENNYFRFWYRMTSRRRPTPLRLDSISEMPEYFDSQRSAQLNLGTESPTSILRPSMTPTSATASALGDWGKVGMAVNAHIPARTRAWRSLSWVAGTHQGFRKFQKEKVDRDCGICFDPALNPRKTSCCGQVFCYAHLADWLRSSKNCPSCSSICTPTFGSLSTSSSMTNLASMAKNRKLPSPVPLSASSSSSDEDTSSRSSSTSSPLLSPGLLTPLRVDSAELFPSLESLWPTSSAVNRVVGQEIGKLLIWIAFILVLCIIASPA